ncbi:response regulator transcription factor [Roseivirga misakiensis]|uniref:Transcriptional regulator n=1 Tax=Roseivirga misakiensis TaxID=1563681 RepID=A0A1E5T730_9BACT|nr:response regulator [Roseivirga misakiensis]OEK07173.1 transcriptional regulator [Roseivirga misakiensis]
MKKVLIVDDEPNILISLEFLLRKSNYEVFVARDGAEAIEILQLQKPDFTILDVMMPNVDGYEVCQFIKNSPAFKHIKVVFLSAKSKEEDIQKGYDLGADLYLTKPFSTRTLVKQIEAIQ